MLSQKSFYYSLKHSLRDNDKNRMSIKDLLEQEIEREVQQLKLLEVEYGNVMKEKNSILDEQHQLKSHLNDANHQFDEL